MHLSGLLPWTLGHFLLVHRCPPKVLVIAAASSVLIRGLCVLLVLCASGYLSSLWIQAARLPALSAEDPAAFVSLLDNRKEKLKITRARLLRGSRGPLPLYRSVPVASRCAWGVALGTPLGPHMHFDLEV